MISSYTWAKSIDTTSGIRNQGFDTLYPQNSYCLSCERGLSAFDTRHRLVTSVLYDLPVGKGKLAEHHQPGGEHDHRRLAGGRHSDACKAACQEPWASAASITPAPARGGYDRPNCDRRQPLSRQPHAVALLESWTPLSKLLPDSSAMSAATAISGPGIIGFDAEVHKQFRMPYKEGHAAPVPLRGVQCSESPELGDADAEHPVRSGAARTCRPQPPIQNFGVVSGTHDSHAPDPVGAEIFVLISRHEKS